MEDEVPDVYLRWLNTPADWLEGCTPGEYFDRFSDSAQLCALLCGDIQGSGFLCLIRCWIGWRSWETRRR